tara:strand:+ start:455 stop:922 length:468 start_codon:yes stop_codon:yes gene_type:complete
MALSESKHVLTKTGTQVLVPVFCIIDGCDELAWNPSTAYPMHTADGEPDDYCLNHMCVCTYGQCENRIGEDETKCEDHDGWTCEWDCCDEIIDAERQHELFGELDFCEKHEGFCRECYERFPIDCVDDEMCETCRGDGALDDGLDEYHDGAACAA